jgi:DNA helicase HerA-like ATPase
MLQEVRKFGEGLVLICRNPAIGDDILRETNQKIVHKLDLPQDVNKITDTLSLTSVEKELLKRLPPGVAFVRIAGNPTTLIRVRPG